MKLLRILPLLFLLPGCVSFNNTSLTSEEPSTQLHRPDKKPLSAKKMATNGSASSDL